MGQNRKSKTDRPAGAADAMLERAGIPAHASETAGASTATRASEATDFSNAAASRPSDLLEIRDSPSIVPDQPHAFAPACVTVKVTLVCGGYSCLPRVDAPVVVTGGYKGLPIGGVTKVFDELLDASLTRALDRGMIGLELGQLFPVDVQRLRETGRVKARCLLLVGMGEPSRFVVDDLQFAMSNVTLALKDMGYDHLAMVLPGMRRHELAIDDAVRGVIRGIRDGYHQLNAVSDVMREERACVELPAAGRLHVMLVEPDPKRLKKIEQALCDEEKALQADKAIPSLDDKNATPALELDWSPGEIVELGPSPESGASDVESEDDVEVTLLRVVRKKPAESALQPLSVPQLDRTEKFEFSALSETAAVAVREDEINAFLIRNLSERMIAPLPGDDREKLGRFFANRMIHKDLLQLTESATNLTLEVDETTAMYPWEMMARKRHGKTSFLGTNVGMSRQFRSLLAPPPSAPPPLNSALRVLVIANPTADWKSLPSASREGLAIVHVIGEARQFWQQQPEQYDVKMDVCIGVDRDDPDVGTELEKLEQEEWIGIESCDPLKIAMRIVDEHYDVIHYAGHGFADAKTGRSGWVLDEEYALSARDIFHVRHVPRLVFANACLSTVLENSGKPEPQPSQRRPWLVNLAQTFLEQGIPNFIGVGWEVDDAAAKECAVQFYKHVLGHKDQPRPETISRALLNGRNAAFAVKKDSTWGAYQHYGRVSDRLLPLPAAEAAQEGLTRQFELQT
jgi:hypothetical protein